jgi:predicted O-methyltransferase YrrM
MSREWIAKQLERAARRLCPERPARQPATPSFESRVRIRGLAWGGFALQMEYEYVPEVRPLEATRGGQRIAERILRDRAAIEAMIDDMARFRESLGRIAAEPNPADPEQPHWSNGWLPAADASMLYALAVSRHPRTYLEIGSGNSTKFVRRAIRDHGLATRIVSLDPQPRAEIDAICDEVVREPIEKVDIAALAERLQPGDVVFVDNSHRGFQNSDVTITFLELMPALPPGTLFGVHDICLPFDYAPCFRDYFYNEQYYLGMYLLGGGGGDTVLMPTFFACAEARLKSRIARAIDIPAVPKTARGGSSFWLELGVPPTPAGG